MMKLTINYILPFTLLLAGTVLFVDGHAAIAGFVHGVAVFWCRRDLVK